MKKFRPYLLLAPQIMLSGLLVAGLVNGLIQSLGVIPALGMHEFTLDYYRETMSKNDMVASVLFSLYIAIASAFISTAAGVVLAAVLVSAGKTKGILMRIVQAPVIVPHVVVAIFIINICSSNGLLARCSYMLGFISEQQQFPNLVYDRGGIGIILAYVWKEIPFIIFFIISLMANINEKPGEAAMNLGAGRISIFFRITLPLCMRPIISGFLIIFVFALGSYELPMLLGPTVPRTLPVLAYVQYIHPDMQNRPYAMALNGIIILISAAAAVIYYRIMRNSIHQLRGGRSENI